MIRPHYYVLLILLCKLLQLTQQLDYGYCKNAKFLSCFPDEIHECYKLRDGRKFDYLENKLREDEELMQKILSEIREKKEATVN
jgi:hypothetical protein